MVEQLLDSEIALKAKERIAGPNAKDNQEIAARSKSQIIY